MGRLGCQPCRLVCVDTGVSIEPNAFNFKVKQPKNGLFELPDPESANMTFLLNTGNYS
jgi:hypothetical protein